MRWVARVVGVGPRERREREDAELKYVFIGSSRPCISTNNWVIQEGKLLVDGFLTWKKLCISELMRLDDWHFFIGDCV